MMPMDKSVIAEVFKMGPPKKCPHSTTGASSSSYVPRVQTMHSKMDHMERVMDFHGQQLAFQNELQLQ